MRKVLNVSIFILVQIAIIFFQIQKTGSFTKASFLKQRNEKALSDLIEERNVLRHKSELLRSKNNIKNYAKAIGMAPLELNQLKKIGSNLQDGNKV